MRTIGIVLIIAGILLAVFTGFNFQTEKEIAKVGPLEINKKESHHIGWPTYIGGLVAVLGIALVVGDKKKS